MKNLTDRFHASSDAMDDPAHRQQRGLIVFCEKNLRYEKGLKAWIFLGPYLLGAFALEILFTHAAPKSHGLLLGAGLVAYLIVFPIIWRKFLRFVASAKPGFVPGPPSAR